MAKARLKNQVSQEQDSNNKKQATEEVKVILTEIRNEIDTLSKQHCFDLMYDDAKIELLKLMRKEEEISYIRKDLKEDVDDFSRSSKKRVWDNEIIEQKIKDQISLQENTLYKLTSDYSLIVNQINII